MHLHRADDPVGAAGNQEDGAFVSGVERAPPPAFGIGSGQRREKTDGRAGVDGVDEQLRQGADVGVRRRRTKPLDAARAL